jgi:hypothetical protein
VRLAQRIPVRIKLDRVPDDLRLIVGRTATVSVDQPPASRSSSSRKGASPIRDRITLKRMFFYDPGSRFAWPG